MSTDTYSESCPACGESFGRNTEDDARLAVIGHMVSKVDEPHKGIGYQTALRRLEAEQIDDEIDVDVEPDVGPSRSATDGGRIQQLPEPDVDDDPETCPNCGSVDAVEPIDELLTEVPDSLLERVDEDLRAKTWVCANCTVANDQELTTEVW